MLGLLSGVDFLSDGAPRKPCSGDTVEFQLGNHYVYQGLSAFVSRKISRETR